MAVAVVWVAVLLGSVELEAFCAHLMFTCVCVCVGGRMEGVACTCKHAFMLYNIVRMSAAGSACVTLQSFHERDGVSYEKG